MIARDIISKEIMPLRCEDSTSKALITMELFKIQHLPLIHNSKYIGLISDSYLYDLEEKNLCFKDTGNQHITPYVYENQHILEALRKMNEFEITSLPVLNKEGEYVGVVLQSELIKKLGSMLSVSQDGGIIILEMNATDLFVSQVSQILESCDTKLHSLFVIPKPESTKIHVTIKVNRVDLTPVIHAFARFDYNIYAIFMDMNKNNSELEERYQSLLKYMEF